MRQWFCLFLLAIAAHAADPRHVDLLLVAADDATLAPLLRRLTDPSSERHGVWTLWTGSLAGKSVVLTRSEGDPLNAVAATTLALRAYTPRLVFVFGTARPHDPALQDGQVVVSRAFAAFDGIMSPSAGLGDGTHPLTWSKLPHALMTSGEKEIYTETFPADDSARSLALRIELPGGRTVEGVLGSGSQMNQETDRIAFLREQWHTSTEDGESAHVAGCAALFNLPVIGARVVNGTPELAAQYALQFVERWK